MDLGIERRELPAERLLAIELKTTPERFVADLSAAFGEIGEVLAQIGAAVTGPGICAQPLAEAEIGQRVVVAGIPFTYEGEIEPGDGMAIEEFSGGPALVGTLHGSYDQLPEAWTEMRAALAEHGKARPKAMSYEYFVRSMANVVNSDELITELVIPLV
ncbi:MAG: GyrI-like domain-containing protein [Gaiellaceae bacterium]|jgi:effector-binding domain-containing protein